MTQTAKKSPFSMNVDLMHGPIFKNLLLFMLPIFISSLFQQLYNTVDTMIVGNVLGDTALAAIGSCGSIYELLVGFGLGIGNGLAIVAVRSYGAQDHDLLKKTVAGSLVIGLVASLCITLAGVLGLHPLLLMLDTPAEILDDAYRYILTIDLGVLVMFAYNLCAGLLRAIGNSVMPLVFLLISSGLNVVLDLLFIARMGMGVQGAAVATVISQGVSVVLCILYIFFRVKILLPEKQHFRVGSHLYWELFSQSISMGLMSSIVSAGSVVLQYGINGLGTLVIAGHTAARKLFSFTTMPVMAMASACSTFVSQNRGANQPERVRKGMKEIALYSVAVAVLAIFLMQLGAEWMVRLISGSSESVVLENGARYLLWNAPFYSVLGVLLATRYALQSLGQKILPLFSSVIELVGKVVFVLFFIPKFAYNAVILCEPIIWCFMAAYLVLVYLHDPFVFPKKAE
jgi:putative MATE family efflux protein